MNKKIFLISLLFLLILIPSIQGTGVIRIVLDDDMKHKDTRPLMIKPYVYNTIVMNDNIYRFRIMEVNTDYPEPFKDDILLDIDKRGVYLFLNQSEYIDLDNDYHYDLIITLKEVRQKMSFITFRYVSLPYGFGGGGSSCNSVITSINGVNLTGCSVDFELPEETIKELEETMKKPSPFEIFILTLMVIVIFAFFVVLILIMINKIKKHSKKRKKK